MNEGHERRLDVPERYDFAGTVGVLPMGRHDPCLRLIDGVLWWAARTPDGLGTLRLQRDGGGLLATGYGPGASWLLDRADAVAGLRDDISDFEAIAARHPVVAELHRRHPGLRLPATGRIHQRLMRAVLEQKVTGTEAYRAYAATVRYCHRVTGGEPAPGPVGEAHTVGQHAAPGLLPPPDPAVVASIPYWVMHGFGVEQRRADTLARASTEASRLERCQDAATANRRLVAIQGIGAWTSAEVVRIAYGDPDAVSVGDYHIPHMVSWALARQARAGSRDAGPFATAGALSPADDRMLELLEPFRGHRGRVCALLERGGYGSPRFGPRMTIRSFAAF